MVTETDSDQQVESNLLEVETPNPSKGSETNNLIQRDKGGGRENPTSKRSLPRTSGPMHQRTLSQIGPEPNNTVDARWVSFSH